MKNFVQRGDTVTITAPYDRLAGQGVLLTAIFGVCVNDALSAAEVEVKTSGVFDITAASADTPAVGAKLYWDNTAKQLTTTSSGNTYVGVCLKAKLNGELTARCKLTGIVP